MTIQIGAYGTQLALTASVTFPVGIPLSAFSDDTDPFDLPAVQIAETAKGVNGDQLAWSNANSIIINIAMIPGSEDDKNLGLLFQANNPSAGGTLANDIITLTAVYPDNSTITVSGGTMTSGMPGKSVASAGRLKTNAYIFSFEQLTETPATSTSVIT